MFTQVIARWLSRLFAWWPWGRSATTSYPQVVGMNTSPTPEQIWRRNEEGPATQPGTTSVAVEHGVLDEEKPARPHPAIPDRIEHSPLSQPSASNSNEPFISASRVPETTGKELQAVNSDVQLSHAPHEQHLEFLRFLFQRGLLNEGFAQDEVPDQYRKNR